MHGFVACRLAIMPTYKSEMSRKIPNLSGVSTRFLRRKAHVEAQTPDSLMFLRDISILKRLKKRICEPCRPETPDSFTFLRDILKNKRDTMEAGMKKVLLNVTPRQESHLYRALLPG